MKTQKKNIQKTYKKHKNIDKHHETKTYGTIKTYKHSENI